MPIRQEKNLLTDRREGMVLIVLLTVSTIVMLTIAGVCYVIGGMHYDKYVKQTQHAEAAFVEDGALSDARMHAFLA